ncbi:TlpA disulfide reductase family protein [Pedobacter miscanthi]|jgi:thiol-disulfide isomerase/thioredoxin|uniref:TlpA family protein disulfide reductase n=1 Tax=Pedobacter miscanthi TaxID=2259170 RepID=UPI00292D03D8|nr:TlpA disulfide reductase family protein [Pedobacter miscanthi]
MIVYLKRSFVAAVMLVAATWSARAQSAAPVSMDVEFSSALHQEGAKLKLYREWPKRALIDTGSLDNQRKFTFHVSDSLPAVFTLSARKPFMDQTIILDKGICRVVLNADSQLTVSGGEKQAILEAYLKMMKPMEKDWAATGNKYMKAANLEEKLLAEKENQIQAEKVQSVRLAFVKKNANNIIGQWLAHTNINLWREKDLAVLKEIFYATRKNNVVSDEIEQKLLLAQANRFIGKKAPLFTLLSLQGDTVSLAQLLKNNKFVLLDFWASWCTPCRATNRNIAPIYADLKKKGIEIVSVSVDENKDLWKKAILADAIPWVQLIAPTAMKSKAVLNYQVKTLPATFLINQDGIVVKQNLELKDLESMLKNGL